MMAFIPYLDRSLHLPRATCVVTVGDHLDGAICLLGMDICRSSRLPSARLPFRHCPALTPVNNFALPSISWQKRAGHRYDAAWAFKQPHAHTQHARVPAFTWYIHVISRADACNHWLPNAAFRTANAHWRVAACCWPMPLASGFAHLLAPVSASWFHDWYAIPSILGAGAHHILLGLC